MFLFLFFGGALPLDRRGRARRAAGRLLLAVATRQLRPRLINKTLRARAPSLSLQIFTPQGA
jgi:hypothetical protein